MDNLFGGFALYARRSVLSFSVFSGVFAALFFVFALSVLAQNKITIRVAPETTIENERIELGNIARIAGEENKIARLKSISLGYAPSVGMLRELTKDRINLAISAAGFSAGEYAIESPAKIIVRRAAQSVGENLLREAIEKSVSEQLKTEGVNFKIVRLNLPSKVEIPSGNVSVKANLGNSRNIFAPFSVALEIQIDARVIRRISAMTQIEAYADVLTTTRDLLLGEKITANDVKVENRLLEKPLTSYIRNAGKLRGLKVTKNLAAGIALTTDSVAAGAVIKTGDLIQIQAQSENLKIVMNGEARTNGKIGDRISVKNTQSGAIMQAVVLDEKTVKVNF